MLSKGFFHYVLWWSFSWQSFVTKFQDEVSRRSFATKFCDEVSRRSFATKFHDEVSWQSFVLKFFFDLKCLNVLTETAACVFWLSRHAACCGNRPSIKQIIYHENNIRNLFSICLLNDIESNSFWRNLIIPVPNISTVFYSSSWSLNHFFLTVGQNNFQNKIPFIIEKFRRNEIKYVHTDFSFFPTYIALCKRHCKIKNCLHQFMLKLQYWGKLCRVRRGRDQTADFLRPNVAVSKGLLYKFWGVPNT